MKAVFSASGRGQQGERPSDRGSLVDPRAPRFGQAITATVLAVGIVFQQPLLVYLIAVVLVLAVASRWRLDVYALLWRHGVARVVDPPPERESADPHRFAKLVGAVFTGAATVALLAGVPFIGYALAAVVAVLAGLGATTGFCLGCRLYGQVAFLRRLGWV